MIVLFKLTVGFDFQIMSGSLNEPPLGLFQLKDIVVAEGKSLFERINGK